MVMLYYKCCYLPIPLVQVAGARFSDVTSVFHAEGRDDLAAGVGVPGEAFLATFQTIGWTIEESRLCLPKVGLEKKHHPSILSKVRHMDLT